MPRSEAVPPPPAVSGMPAADPVVTLRTRSILAMIVLPIAASVGLLSALFMVQATVVIGHFEPSYLVMPSSAGAIVGCLCSVILLMRARMRDAAAAFRALVDMSPVFSMRIAADGGVSYVSPACFSVTGYGPAAFREDPALFDRLVDAADQDAWRAACKTVRSEPVAVDLRLRRHDGTTVWISYQAAPVRRPDGRADGVRCSVIDITKRKRAETALQQSEQRLRAIAESSPVPLLISRWSDGILLYANPQVAATLGVDRASMFGQRMSAFLWDPIDRDDLRMRLARDEYVANWALEMRRSDGARLSTVHSLRIIVYDGEPAILGSFIDVSEQRRDRAALEESELRFRAIAESLPMSLMITRRADGKVLYANPHSGYVLRMNPEEAVGRHISEFYWNPDERPVRMAAVDAEGYVPSRPMEARRDDGTRVTGVVSMRAIVYDGEPALVTCFNDLTEQIGLQEQLRQAQKMQAVGELTGGVAHDFNNLLGAIIGSAELLHAGIVTDDESRDRLLRTIIRASEHGASLTRQLLAFSRRQTLAPETVALDRLVDNMADLLRRTLGEAITVETRHPPDLWPCVADPAQLESAILNLAINARDAMPDGGQLMVETANAIFDDEFDGEEPGIGPGAYASVTVSDSGVGMPAGVVDRAFEPFFTTKGVGDGTGLGLSMVYGFAKQSGGHATIQSEVGVGTSVRLFLPRAVETAADDGTGDDGAAHPAGAGELILLVEDDGDVRAAAANMLDSLGYRVHQAVDGASALVLLERHPDIDLLLSDVVLPGGMSGPDIACRALERRPDLKVLFMSGYPDKGTACLGAAISSAPLLAKPFRRGDLARRVGAVLAGG